MTTVNHVCLQLFLHYDVVQRVAILTDSGALLELVSQVIKPLEDTTARSYRQDEEHWNVRRSTPSNGHVLLASIGR